jgi:hypothetical protein
MIKLESIAKLIAATAIAAAAFAFHATPSAAAGTVIECDVDGPNETALHARYEERVRSTIVRKKFDVQFEAIAGRGFTAGQRITFLVGSVAVGSAVLKVIVGSELAAELSLDSRPDNGDKPFPANWPGIHSGSIVKAKLGTQILLACTVR